jgi:adenylate cyclase class 2
MFLAMKLFARRRIRRDRVLRPPHIEIEVRFRLPDPKPALEQLRGAGVRFGKLEFQDDQAYAPAGWDYGNSRIGVTFARLRTSRGKHLFTVKRPVTDVCTCIEHECLVSDREAMHEAILLMGFAATIRIAKSRAMGQLGELTFCLDQVEGLGRFLEVERLAAANDDVDAVRVEIETFLHEIGVRAERCHDTYDALLYARSERYEAARVSDLVAA